MKGLTHIYYGNGKGKTTAAIGAAIRAVGRKKKVLFVQFMKTAETGEVSVLCAIPNVRVLRQGKSRPSQRVRRQQAMHEECNALLKQALCIANQEAYDLLILDELLSAHAMGLVDTALVDALVLRKPEAVELILTGWQPEQKILDWADYASEIKKVKHPYDMGIPAREGIEL